MNNSFVISIIKPNHKQLKMALACARSLRALGHKEDINLITYDRSLKVDWLKVRYFDPIEHDSLKEKEVMSWWLLSLCDLGRVCAWSLTEYDRIIILDPDIMFHRNVKHYWDLYPTTAGHSAGSFGPLNGGFIVSKPDAEMLPFLMDSTFNYETGWNNIGKRNWEFQAANAGQGFLFYYFTYVKRDFRYMKGSPEWTHYSGRGKNSPKYNSEIGGLIPYI